MELYSAMGLYVFQNELTYYIELQAHSSSTAVVSCRCTLLHSCTAAVVMRGLVTWYLWTLITAMIIDHGTEQLWLTVNRPGGCHQTTMTDGN